LAAVSRHASGMTDKSFWDHRYAEHAHVWSGHPNTVLAREVTGLRPGRALDLGCGEGGDAIFLARSGWAVTAVDISVVALEKAAAHAAEAGVTVDFQQHDLGVSFPGGRYDLVSVQFLHSRDGRLGADLLRTAAAAVAPGGILLIEMHQDFGPFGAPQDWDGRAWFPEPDEIVAALRLAEGEWEVLLSERHDRVQTGPDGQPAHRTDGTVKARRLPR
jgi:SAM-dependent methyltransferase